MLRGEGLGQGRRVSVLGRAGREQGRAMPWRLGWVPMLNPPAGTLGEAGRLEDPAGILEIPRPSLGSGRRQAGIPGPPVEFDGGKLKRRPANLGSDGTRRKIPVGTVEIRTLESRLE